MSRLITTPTCPACGGPWRENLGRYWHKGHPADCARKLAQRNRERQDAEAKALRGSGGIVVQPCGCRGAEHDPLTCERWASDELGQEYAGSVDA